MLSVFAGENALQHIRKNGLSPADIRCVMGASGAAKWLAIAGLDKAIFGHWLNTSPQHITLYGTSVGAFKLAAAAHADPVTTLDRLARAYIEQQYRGATDADAIAEQMEPVIQAVAGYGAVEQVLSHATLRLQFGAVRCLDEKLASGDIRDQQQVMARAFGANLRSRQRLQSFVQRTTFSDVRLPHGYSAVESKGSSWVALTAQNYRAALIASGSLPVYMHAVVDIPGAPTGVYRDGGLLDYHPIPSSEAGDGSEKLILYPHFYPRLTEGWFDKFLPWRKVSTAALTNVVLLCPSKRFIASLEGGKIPDRHDFLKFQGRDATRMQRWNSAVAQSDELGEQFLQWVCSGRIADEVKPL